MPTPSKDNVPRASEDPVLFDIRDAVMDSLAKEFADSDGVGACKNIVTVAFPGKSYRITVERVEARDA